MSNDITFCSGLECPLKNKCKRYRIGNNSEFISYFISPPFTIKKNANNKIKSKKIECDFYINNGGVTELVSLKDIFTGNMPKIPSKKEIKMWHR